MSDGWYGESCPSYVVIVAHPEQFMDQANLFYAYSLGIASGVLGALLSHWRLRRT